MRIILFLFAICTFGTSCAVGYGCPYSSTEQVQPTVEQSVVAPATLTVDCDQTALTSVNTIVH